MIELELELSEAKTKTEKPRHLFLWRIVELLFIGFGSWFIWCYGSQLVEPHWGFAP